MRDQFHPEFLMKNINDPSVELIERGGQRWLPIKRTASTGKINHFQHERPTGGQRLDVGADCGRRSQTAAAATSPLPTPQSFSISEYVGHRSTQHSLGKKKRSRRVSWVHATHCPHWSPTWRRSFLLHARYNCQTPLIVTHIVFPTIMYAAHSSKWIELNRSIRKRREASTVWLLWFCKLSTWTAPRSASRRSLRPSSKANGATQRWQPKNRWGSFSVFQVHDFNDDLNVKPIKALERMHQSGTRSQLKYLRTLQADVTELLRVCTVEPKSLKELAFRKTRITKVPRPSTTPKPQSVSSASSSREKSLEKAFSLTSEESSGMLIDQIRWTLSDRILPLSILSFSIVELINQTSKQRVKEVDQIIKDRSADCKPRKVSLTIRLVSEEESQDFLVQ